MFHQTTGHHSLTKSIHKISLCSQAVQEAFALPEDEDIHPGRGKDSPSRAVSLYKGPEVGNSHRRWGVSRGQEAQWRVRRSLAGDPHPSGHAVCGLWVGGTALMDQQICPQRKGEAEAEGESCKEEAHTLPPGRATCPHPGCPVHCCVLGPGGWQK